MSEPELEPIYASTTGQLECGCWFDQPGVIHAGDWRDCPDHGPLMKVLDAQTSAPEVIGATAALETLRVRILLNPDPAATIHGYRPGTTVYPVMDYQAEDADHKWLAAQAWRIGNSTSDIAHGDTERVLADRYRATASRSLRCGDIVAIGASFYACAAIGWEPIAEPFIGPGPLPTIEASEAVSPARPDLLNGPI